MKGAKIIENKYIRQNKTIIKRPKSLKPTNINENKTKLNSIIHINIFQNPFEDINQELKDIKKRILKTETSKDKENKILIQKANINITKEKIIISLKKELKFQKLLNKNLLQYKEYSNKIYNYYKKNYEDINKYKIQLHLDLADFVNLVDNYENTIKNFKNENSTMIKTNENIINYKINEQVKMKDRLEKLNNDTQKQHDIIEKLTNTLTEYINKNKQNEKKIEKNEFDHEYKYQTLLDNFKNLENEYKYYLDMEINNRKNQLDGNNKNLFSEEEGMALLKLNEKEVKRDFLKNIIKDIQSQIKEIEQLNKKIGDDKNLEKLLGKIGAQKYKKRIQEKYKNKNSDINP